MRREDIALVARARYDAEARREVGRRYLIGEQGFPQNERLALQYLVRENVVRDPEVARIIADHLALEQILEQALVEVLQVAAARGSAEAWFKIGVCSAVSRDTADARRAIAAAARQGHLHARRVEAELLSVASDDHVALVAILRRCGNVRVDPVVLRMAKDAVAKQDLDRLVGCIRLARRATEPCEATIADCVRAAIRLALNGGKNLMPLRAQEIESSLEVLVAAGDIDAAFWLGSAYCGADVKQLRHRHLVQRTNLRRGAVLLLRAADGGRVEAWMHLYRVHVDRRSSVANPLMARFCLEKAATHGDLEAKRVLGVSLLRSSAALDETEQALHWLHACAEAGDRSSQDLMETLVLPVQGHDEEAAAAADRVRRIDPWIAARLELSRAFGLTKLEALCVDPIAGRRSWGLVVGKNPYVVLPKLAAARAVPSVRAGAEATLERVVRLFDVSGRGRASSDDDGYRNRAAKLRKILIRLDVDEALFFARANTKALERLRKGAKWAHREKPQLSMAMLPARPAAEAWV